MSAIKECTRCEKVVPHHGELDKICMQCEMEKYYPDDKMAFHIRALKANAFAMDTLNKTGDVLDEIDEIINERKSILGRLLNIF